MHRQMRRLIALNQVLRLFFRSSHRLPLECDFRRDLLLDRPPDTAGFRIPRNVIAWLEVFYHPRLTQPQPDIYRGTVEARPE
jgi:hypothetical protein